MCIYATAKSLQLCPTLCDPIDSSPPGSPIPGILQARTLEWVAISFFNAWKWKMKVKSLSCVWPLETPWFLPGFSVKFSSVAQLCPTLCFSVHGIFQVRVLEWGALAFSARTSHSPLYSPYRAVNHSFGAPPLPVFYADPGPPPTWSLGWSCDSR